MAAFNIKTAERFCRFIRVEASQTINPSDGAARPPYLRLSMGDESQRLYREANVLYWAIALLDLAYSYIDQCIANTEHPPPFNVPQLRFVEAGLLFVYAD